MRIKADTSTTGRVVSSLAVFSGRALNALPENHEEPDVREALGREVDAILRGQRGVHPKKLAQRCMERCATARWN